MDEIACLQGDAVGAVLAGRRVDLVFGLDLESRYRDRFRPLARSSARALVVLALAALTLMAAAAAPAAPAAPSGRSFVVLGGLCGRGAALLLGLLLEQRLTVGDRDLVVVGMNFGKG